MYLLSCLRTCKRSHAVFMYHLPAQQMWTLFGTNSSAPDVVRLSQANSHLVKTASSCMPLVPTIRLPYGSGLCKRSSLCQILRAMDGPPTMMDGWSSNGCVEHPHPMSCCSCSPASVWGHANCQNVHVSATAWSSQICANYKPVPINPVRKSRQQS